MEIVFPMPLQRPRATDDKHDRNETPDMAATPARTGRGKESIFLVTAIAVACFLVFRDYLTFQKVYLFKDIGSDSLNIYYPWLVHLSDYIRSYGIPTWTFSQGLGQNIFPFWLGDFFSDFLIFFVSKPNLPFGLAWMEALKVLLCGITFHCYLRELKLDGFSAALGAFLYAFCGYLILGGCWTLFSVEALYAALILLGFERWLNRGRWLLFVCGLTCMSLLQPFFLFMYALFFLTYIPVRYMDVHPGEWRAFPLFFLKTAGLATLGVAASAYQLFPDVLQYLESPRVMGEAGLTRGLLRQPVFAIAEDLLRFSTTFRAFGSDMIGTGSKFTGWQNYLESPLFYCGILCLVTFTQFIPSRATGRQKFAYGIFTLVWTLPVIFPFFRYAFWAFSGNYFRTLSLLITIILVTGTARALHRIMETGKLNKTVLCVTVLFLFYLLYTPPAEFRSGINQHLRIMTSLLIGAYAVLLVALAQQGRYLPVGRILMVVVCFAEMVGFSHRTVNDRAVVTARELQEKVGYNDNTAEAAQFLKSSDNGFYRVVKSYSSGPAIHTSLNDAKVQGFYGISSYASFNQINYIRFLSSMDVLNQHHENETRWVSGLESRLLLVSLLSCKYWLSKQPEPGLRFFGFKEVAAIGGINIYRNSYAMPLGFTYDQVMEEQAFLPLAPELKDVYLWKACVVASGEKDLASFTRVTPTYLTPAFGPEQLSLLYSAFQKEELKLTKFAEKQIVGEITVPKTRILFLSIPYDEGWHARVNGVDTGMFRANLGFTGIVLPAGKSIVELQFTPRLMKPGAAVSLLALAVILTLLVAPRLTGRNRIRQGD
jgi:uncharacterized membrane protein YfhO